MKLSYDDSFVGSKRTLKSAIEYIASIAHDWADHEEDTQKRALKRLAGAGRDLLEAMVRPGKETEEARAKKLGWLRDFFPSVSELVSTPGCTIPWEFIYLGNDPDNPQIEDFLGYHTNVERCMGIGSDNQYLPPLESEDFGSTGTSIFDNECWLNSKKEKVLSITVAQDRSLGTARCGSEIEMLGRYGFGIDEVSPLNPANRDYGMDLFKDYMEGAELISHFNCHAAPHHVDSGRQIEAKIVITNEFGITRSDLVAVPFAAKSIVVLNSCHGGQLDEFSDLSVTSALASKFVGAVVAALDKVPDVFATLWAQEFYSTLLSGASVGEALMNARKKIAKEKGNPAIFLYVVFGPLHARIPARLTEAA